MATSDFGSTAPSTTICCVSPRNTWRLRGTGRFNDRGEWTSVHAEQLTETPSWSEPFDLDTFLADPDPRIFDPDTVVTIDLTDDEWAAFDGAIREGREA